MDNPKPHKTFKSLSRRQQASILGFIVFLGAAIAAVLVFQSDRTDEAAQPTTTKAADSFQPSPDQWATLKMMPVQEMDFHSERSADGKITLNDDATTPVFSPYSGHVLRLQAKPGDVVQQNDLLFTIDATEYVQAENDLIDAASALKTARAQLKLATTAESRQHELYNVEGSALKNWQQSQSDLATAQATLRSDEVAYSEARNHLRILGKSDADIDKIEHAPDAQKMDAEATVNAPIAGIVIQRQIAAGQYIQAGSSTPVYTIGDLSKVWLQAYVSETDAPLMHVDAPVDIQVLALPGQVFHAKLSYVAPQIDPSTHRLAIRADVENIDGALKPEMFATFDISTGDSAKGLAIPSSAVIYEGDLAHVWLAQDDKTVMLRKVQVGRTSGDMVEITDGLTTGDKIVTSGALFIDRAASSD